MDEIYPCWHTKILEYNIHMWSLKANIGLALASISAQMQFPPLDSNVMQPYEPYFDAGNLCKAKRSRPEVAYISIKQFLFLVRMVYHSYQYQRSLMQLSIYSLSNTNVYQICNKLKFLNNKYCMQCRLNAFFPKKLHSRKILLKWKSKLCFQF